MFVLFSSPARFFSTHIQKQISLGKWFIQTYTFFILFQTFLQLSYNNKFIPITFSYIPWSNCMYRNFGFHRYFLGVSIRPLKWRTKSNCGYLCMCIFGNIQSNLEKHALALHIRWFRRCLTNLRVAGQKERLCKQFVTRTQK